MTNQIKKILVVGGGTAGWITAGLIAVEHGERNGIEVTLVESPTISPIGVGEGTWPTMRTTLRKLGISETEFIRQCDASFKQASKFVNWVNNPEENPQEDNNYYHPFTIPAKYIETNLALYWQKFRKEVSFANALSFQTSLCDRGLAPKQITTPEYACVANYGYHLDSSKFSEMLKKHAIAKLGVKFISDDVTGVISGQNDEIEAVITKRNGKIVADLFVDCSGFSSLLLGQHYQVPFIEVNKTLFADKALAVQIPYASELSPIASHTLSTAQKAGWIWDIGLSSRRGIGYVYSSAHTTREKAEDELARYVEFSGGKINKQPVREIDIRAGYRASLWHKNCVAVGLSGGFLEPLEASSLVMVELAATAICDALPATHEIMGYLSRKFNEIFQYRWESIINFLKLHYILTKRTDSDFWIDNCRSESIPASLREMIEIWRYRAPWQCDFIYRDEVFSAASYQYVLYGMGFETRTNVCSGNSVFDTIMRNTINENRAYANRVVQALPDNRDLVNKIKEFGLSKI